MSFSLTLFRGASDSERARGSLRQTLARPRRAGVTIVTPELASVALPGTMDTDVDLRRARTAEEPPGRAELAIENAALHPVPDTARARAFGERAEAAGTGGLPPVRAR